MYLIENLKKLKPSDKFMEWRQKILVYLHEMLDPVNKIYSDGFYNRNNILTLVFALFFNLWRFKYKVDFYNYLNSQNQCLSPFEIFTCDFGDVGDGRPCNILLILQQYE